MTRRPDRRAGWERIEFQCWHKIRATLRGIPSVIDLWEYEAHSNPCKLINCPHRVRAHEEV